MTAQASESGNGLSSALGADEGRDCERPLAYRVEVREGAPVNFRVESSASPIPARSHCYESIIGRSLPCPGCPAVALACSPGSRQETTVVPSGSGYRVFVGERAGAGQYLVHSLPLSEPTLSGLQRLRVDRIASRAGLSRRELAVLELLLHGRASSVIASALGITERTVRFHISNVLTKLEADSRADLLRLLA